MMDVENALNHADNLSEFSRAVGMTFDDGDCCTTLAAEVQRLRSINAELVDAIDRVVGINCHQLHHNRDERHEYDEPCPVEAKIHAALARAKEKP